MSEENDTRYSHRIFRNDPIQFKSFINKRVLVTAKDGSVHNGILYTVDPVSESVVLVERENDGKFQAKVIVGHSIEDAKILLGTNSENDEFLELPEFFKNKQSQLSESELANKKEALKKLLVDNRFPITEDSNGVLEIHGMVSIEPPYDLENCLCTNPIIMTRIQAILSQLTKEQ